MRSLSTGEAAKITKTSVQTVIRWINQGMLKAWKVPGSRFRRIEERDLRDFMARHNIPLHFLDTAIERILFVSENESHCARLGRLTPQGRPVICASPFEAGMRMVDSPIAVIVIDASLGESRINQIVSALTSRALKTPVISMDVDSRDSDGNSEQEYRPKDIAGHFVKRIYETLTQGS